ncbi:oxygenase MpaB family protein [Streptomyces sp. NPDC052701]|uniref:oxygenase MpaB family protein n=1 Tax=Streptomyces sp. NPDC052701 TaxID=3155533 RepID=UPI00344212B5
MATRLLPGLLPDGGAWLRDRLGRAIFTRVAGPQGPDNRARIHGAPGPRWFGPDRPVRRVHGDAAMFIGGLSALLLQSLHPLAMAAVAGHSGFRGDPWGRLQRTSTFLAVTTYGPAEGAEEACARVRAVHDTVRGTSPDGRAYSAADPHLLCWVHIAEVDSFLRAHQRYGARPLDDEECDGYVADMARVATALGVPDPPTNRAGLAARLAAYRGELRATAEARGAARFLVLNPPVPLVARLPYGIVAANAVSLLPVWASRALWLPRVPPAEDLCVRPLGTAVTAGIRWALTPPSRDAV